MGPSVQKPTVVCNSDLRTAGKSHSRDGEYQVAIIGSAVASIVIIVMLVVCFIAVVIWVSAAFG